MDALIIEETSALNLKNTCELILEIRRNFKALIWVVSQNLSKTSKMVYLQLGADGVADKEIEQEESILQLSNLLKRVKEKTIGDESERDRFDIKPSEGALDLVPENLSVIVEGNTEVCLTKLEFQIISYLINHNGKAVTYEEIYQHVWKDDYNNCQEGNKQYRVSNLIFHLRKKLEKDSTKPEYIKTIRSKGYMLDL
ncbi:winged helix-turn-helix domain-containing protein [Enterococcus quebecensis]|nr:winged helix-turn-helix domain-containing protein [Enterococcus quebecensis]